MKKEFIPYTQALALKELGFDKPCFRWYDERWGDDLQQDKYNTNKDLFMTDLDCSTPLYQQAFRWFRENHNLMFQIFYLRNGNHAAIIHRTTPEYMDLVDQVRPSSGCVDEVVDCYSYEEAELECLIKLIEIVKNK